MKEPECLDCEEQKKIVEEKKKEVVIPASVNERGIIQAPVV